MKKVIIILIIILGIMAILLAIIPHQNKINEEEGRKMMEQKIKILVNNHELTATLIDNSSTRALVKMLNDGDIIINMTDYAKMEKVGTLEENLPQNNEDIKTHAGDLILYQGNNFVIYYDTNNWSLTRLGKIDNITADELKNILGPEDVTVTISLL